MNPRDVQSPCLSGTTGMSHSIMSEISAHLQALAEHDRSAAIDLRSLPMTEADRRQLEELLGRGEVTANLELAGASEVWETRYPGVWWIRHMGAGGKIATEEIAITRIPEILKTHPTDVEAAARRIRQELDFPDQSEKEHQYV
jgi:hydrogenase-1 operon protein HyaF